MVAYMAGDDAQHLAVAELAVPGTLAEHSLVRRRPERGVVAQRVERLLHRRHAAGSGQLGAERDELPVDAADRTVRCVHQDQTVEASGIDSATTWATIPPMEWPSSTSRPIPGASTSAERSAAMWSQGVGVLRTGGIGDPPWPRRSGATTHQPDSARASM